MTISHLELLRGYVLERSRQDFTQYVRKLLREDQWYGIDHTFLGFMEDYALLSKMIRSHTIEPSKYCSGRQFTIYDVGCATALQHVFFGDCLSYVGIDVAWGPEPKFFLPNCSFHKGKLSEVINSLEIDPENSFGIANMSILYDSSCETDLELFNRVFKRKYLM